MTDELAELREKRRREKLAESVRMVDLSEDETAKFIRTSLDGIKNVFERINRVEALEADLREAVAERNRLRRALADMEAHAGDDYWKQWATRVLSDTTLYGEEG